MLQSSPHHLWTQFPHLYTSAAGLGGKSREAGEPALSVAPCWEVPGGHPIYPLLLPAMCFISMISLSGHSHWAS